MSTDEPTTATPEPEPTTPPPAGAEQEPPAAPAGQPPPGGSVTTPATDRPAGDSGRHASDQAGSRIGNVHEWMEQRRSPGEATGESSDQDASWHNEPADDRPADGTRAGSEFHNVGQTVYGDHAKLFNIQLPDGRQVTVLRSQPTAAALYEADSTYVTVEGFEDACKQLEERHVILLRGAAGTGRRTTAELLLARVAGFNRVVGIENAGADVTLTQLAGQDRLLVRGHGTVLELSTSGEVTAATLRIFDKLARDAEAYVVILEDRADSPDPTLAPYTVTHVPPPAENVLRRHLLRLLVRQERCVGGCGPCSGSCRAEFIERCVTHERIVTELATHPHPGPTVELARSLAGWNGSDEDLDNALGGLDRSRRDFAARLLKQAKAEQVAEDPQGAPRRQAFQIAYATFHGHPLADVFDSGELLLGILRAVESGTDQPTRVVFDGGVDQMLRSWAGESRLAVAESDEQPRRARLADPRLLFAVLDVLWNDFDGVRLPLLFWLDQLVLGPRATGRQRAAEVTGWLATYDFDEVCNTMIRRWAADGRGSARQAAAWALDVAAVDPRLLGRIRGRVRDWVRSSHPLLHDSAARAYGTRIGLLAPEEALRELRTLASRDDLNGSASVARTLVTLYGVAPEATWRTLVDWNGDRLHRLRVHAARGLTLLAERRGRPPEEGWPLLLTSTAGFAPDDGELVTLWQAALVDPTTGFRAWNRLHGWIQLADDDLALADPVVDLASRMLVGRVAARGHFHLREWARKSATARRLLGGSRPSDRSGTPSNPTPGGTQ